MNIIIPMAGMGKRMRPHTLTTAKPLIPIAGKPVVQRLVEDIVRTANEKIETIAFIIAPTFGKATEDMLLNVAQNLGAKGLICYQEEALGTAHAILCAKECLDGNVFIAFADTLFKATFTIDTQKDAIIWTQKVADPSAFGVVKLAEGGRIIEFIEKPPVFVSDLAIIGVYYFKDGANLRKELEYLIDNDISTKGEFQLTDAMENMKNKNIEFYCDQVEEWLDCGNKNATVYTNQRILEIKKDTETLIAASAIMENSIIIPPCFIGENVVLRNSIVGPHVSIEHDAVLEHVVVSNSMIQESTQLKYVNLTNSMLGKHIQYKESPKEISLGDYSVLL
ncbi:nucleotidyltransferase [Taibaiella sp. KBW10]|uniref:sugar nucleotidyltransferase n=1 Tax=Taibaiella sp. KBW10 TaxID=2153357 RepID=UPI000F5A3265|nr:sugar phosphate nucleotidyltransferase [Taibaiella sp. KBW10]RQO30714.1 nucleotidyltransferase [Taibaiella sp. KBW10]